MGKSFEDELMDLQAGMISLCMEVANKGTEKIYVYCSNEDRCTSFNAFFCVDGELKQVHQLGHPMSLMANFLIEGSRDIARLNELCKKYDMSAPTEMKLYYDVKSQSFEGEYKYERVCFGNTDLSAADIFKAWFDEEQEKLVTLQRTKNWN